ncbi:hypothetical protein R5R35_008408 [Gryllus longicercus]|uniref:Lipase domain-containing protein n=1 Tax=Gryllus longicercus TaxID=2509291 RepID=A0AAN9VV00_9ORTH
MRSVSDAAAEMKNVPVCLLDNICADVPQDLVVNFPNKIIIYFYSGTTAYDYETFPLSNITDVLQHPRYDLSRRTLLYLHGFTETPMKESVVTVVTAHLQRGDHNVLSVDWSEVCNRTYREAAVLAPLTGLHVARGLDALVRAGQPLSHVHVVGHSLGGQCAGHVGKALTVGRLPRITALDPARPLFEGVGSPHLQREDALAVVVIHSDGGFYGVRAPTGTVDFFPNGGSRYQPGCSPAPDACAGDAFISSIPSFDTPNKTVQSDFCSHAHSWRFYAASVLDERRYPAVPCASWFHFQWGLCPATPATVAYMGFPDPGRAEGTYYLVAVPP